MANGTKHNSAERNLILYLLSVLFVGVCLVVLISQRYQIARCGREISELSEESIQLQNEQARLRLEVAQQASYTNLLERGKQMGIRLVPPEEAVERQAPN